MDTIKYDLRKLQLEQLSILKEIKRVCSERHLTFYLSCGTCIGAVRHHGCIPWDDDIDIFMFVSDFDKLMKFASDFAPGFFLQNQETDPEYPNMIARVRKNNTACVEFDELDVSCHHGIFVDIYPIFGFPDKKTTSIKLIWESLLYRMVLAGHPPINHGKMVSLIGNLILKLPMFKEKQKFLQCMKKNMNKYEDSNYVAILYGMDVSLFSSIIYLKEWFGEPIYIDFEDDIMPVPCNYDAYLTRRYGDYMKMPPLEAQCSYHTYAIVDFNKDYIKGDNQIDQRR